MALEKAGGGREEEKNHNSNDVEKTNKFNFLKIR